MSQSIPTLSIIRVICLVACCVLVATASFWGSSAGPGRKSVLRASDPATKSRPNLPNHDVARKLQPTDLKTPAHFSAKFENSFSGATASDAVFDSSSRLATYLDPGLMNHANRFEDMAAPSSHSLSAFLVVANLVGTGSISASPNPIQVCDGSGLGITTLSWTSSGATQAEIHVGSPSGALIASGASGKVTTSKSVSDGTVFYLQDFTGKSSLTLATITVGVTTAGCAPAPTPTRTGSITAGPNPIQVCDGSGLGITTLSWTSTGTSVVEVHVGSPTGDLLAQTVSNGTATTGKWVSNGTVFYLQDVSSGLPLTAANTLGTVTVGVTTAGCPQPPLYEGWHDGADCSTIFGWAADRNRLNTSINVDIYDGATLLATVPANQLRSDVGAYLGDNGLHGYSYAVPTSSKNGQPHSITVKFSGTGTNLAGTPKSITCASSRKAPFDFDGDLKSDIAVWRPSEGNWYIVNSSTGASRVQQFGLPSDVIVPADYDGDGKTDIAVWRQSEGNWYIINSSTGASRVQQWGIPTDFPVPADYDGDGKADLAVWRPSDGNWYIINSSTGAGRVQQWGIPTDLPVPADYDGDGKTDLAVWRPSEGNWYIINSSTGASRVQQWGIPSDLPARADYDGDGKTDLAVWRPSEGNWYIINSSTGASRIQQFGSPGDQTVVADYDGDGRADLAVYRPSTGYWYIVNSSNGTFTVQQWGFSTDIPVPVSRIPSTPNAARFISQTVPTSMVAGQSYSVSVTMQNTGTNTWTSANLYRLGSQNPPDNGIWGGRVALPASVAPGSQVTFNFTVTAPSNAGTYNFQWRMVQDGVEWFGDLTPNVVVNVSAPNAATFISQTVPTSMVAGQSYSVSVTMQNTGTNTWTSANLYRLGSQNPPDNGIWGGRVALPASVAPGSQVTFNFTVTAPSNAGTYNFQWRMVQDGVMWFGDPTPNVVVNVASAGLINFMPFYLDPVNRTGTPGEDLFSGNYNWSLPLVGLSGRAGLDLGLSLTYNSLVWTKAGPTIKFDADNGFPAPGFRLAFPVIQPKGLGNGAVPAYPLITSSGARVELRQTSAGIFESMDSSNLQWIEGSKTLRTPDGSILTYLQVTGGNFMCVGVKDRNGNFITVNYVGNRINTIIDTLGRVITFNYGSGNLDSITQTWNGVTHNWARFTYQTVSVAQNFQGLEVIAPPSISALAGVRLADGSSYNFDYTSVGQVSTIRHLAPDTHTLVTTTYTTDGRTDDCPRLTGRQDTAENWNNGSALSTSFQPAFATGTGTATLPDGTRIEETYSLSGFNKGLPTQSKIISGGVAKKTTTTNWEKGDLSLGDPGNPRMSDTTISDDAGNIKRVSFTYTSFGLPSDILEYAAGGTTVLRHTQTDYVMDAPYIDRRIIGLPREQRLYEGGGTANLFSRVSYDYDWGSPFLQNQGAAVQHDEVSYGDAFVQGRGNLSAVNRFDVNTGLSLQVQMAGYNTTGSPIFMRDAIRNVLTINYADAFSAGTPAGQTLAYPTTITDGDNFSSTATYHYDLGVATKTHDPKGAELLMEYNDPVGRLTRRTYFDSINSISGTYTRLEYMANGNEVRGYTLLDPGVESFSAQVTDGAGRTIGSVRNFPGSTGGYSGQRFIYDAMGRRVQQSNPAEISYSLGQPVASWTPIGDDAGGWAFTTQAYDWKGRPTVTTRQDGSSTRRMDYGGCGCAGGEVVTLTDEVQRVKKIYHDVLGRVVKVEDLRPNLAVYRTTANTFDVRDQVTLIRQYDGRDTSLAFQETTMTYDGYGRLIRHWTPIQTAAIRYTYNDDDTIQVVRDPRGATATYAYNNRHLVTGITYAVPFGSNIPDTSPVTFSYDQAGNLSQMTDGTGGMTFDYDTWSRMIRETRFFNQLGAATPFPLNYDYNLAGELKKVVDPFGAEINYTYDQAGQLSSVTGTPFGTAGVTQYATNMRYRAFGGLKHLDYGNNPLQLNMTYTARLQVATMQVQGAPDLLSKQYSYYPDDRLSSSSDLLDSFYSRGYQYDLVGRLSLGLSGPSSPQGISDGPYTQGFDFDKWNNMLGRSTLDTRSFTYTYDSATSRNTRWTYDAAGNVTRDERFNGFTFDASGRLVMASGGKSWSHDGTGRVAKWVLNSASTFNVWSSVLGSVVTELDGTGNKQRTYVYAGSQLLAKQQRGKVFWHHVDASNASSRDSNVNGGLVRRNEIDPLGAPADQSDFPDPDPDIPEPRVSFGNLSTGCLLDGIDTPCSIVMSLLDNGTAVVAPLSTTRWNSTTNKFEFFKAYADGTSGWSPMGAANNGWGYQPPSGTAGTGKTDPWANAIASNGFYPSLSQGQEDKPPEDAPQGCIWVKQNGSWVLNCGANMGSVNISGNSPGGVVDVDTQTALLIKWLREINTRPGPVQISKRLQRKLDDMFFSWEKAQAVAEQPGYDDCISRAANSRMFTDIAAGLALAGSIRGGINAKQIPDPAAAIRAAEGAAFTGAGSGLGFSWAKYNFDNAKADCRKKFPHAVDRFRWNPFTWP